MVFKTILLLLCLAQEEAHSRFSAILAGSCSQSIEKGYNIVVKSS